MTTSKRVKLGKLNPVDPDAPAPVPGEDLALEEAEMEKIFKKLINVEA